MDHSLYRFIFRYSLRDQLVLLGVILASYPFYYYSLDLPKTIVNRAIGGAEFPVQFWGFELEQIPYLLTLSLLFLLLVCINGAFKYYINVAKGQLGERMLRRLRYELYSRVLRFPLPHFRKVSQGEIIPMITAEVEPLGGFIGDAVAQPAYQGGLMLTLLAFMFVQDWVLGLAAVALYPFQGWLIPKLQRQVNLLGKERVRQVRRLSDRIGESISGATELHANAGARLALSRYAAHLGIIYDIRFEIYRRKFFIKFLNNFIAQVTPFFFYAIGGYLVIQGDLSLGALVAVLAAYKDLSAPWKELLAFYQQKEDVRIKYEQVIEQFDPPGVMPPESQVADAPEDLVLEGRLQARNVSLLDEDGLPLVDGLTLSVTPGEKIALVGPAGGGKEAAAQLLARLVLPTGGQLLLDERDATLLPESVTGRVIGYVGAGAYVFNATIRDNLLLGLMQQPRRPGAAAEEPEAVRRLALAAGAGNSTDDPDADWVDLEAAGAVDTAELERRLGEVLAAVDLTDDVYALGLRGTVDPQAEPAVAECILAARRALRERLAAADMAELVESFDEARYNMNASVAENLIFGTPVSDGFDADNLADHPYVQRVLERVGLTQDFLVAGHRVAQTMVELFRDLPADHPFFAQFAFISADDLPEFQLLLGRAERLGLDRLGAEDRRRLMGLPFKLIPARHRLDLIDEALRARILEARRIFREELPAELAASIEFFSREAYNAAASIQDNILFGKIAYGFADGGARVGAALAAVVEELELRPAIVRAGLDFHAGIAGSRLNAAQRQKLALARALLRRPRVLVLNEATAPLDGASQARVATALIERCGATALVWSLHRAAMARHFDRVYVLRGGKVVEDGTFAELDVEGRVLHDMLRTE